MTNASFDELKALLDTAPVVLDAKEKVAAEEASFNEIESLLSQDNKLLLEINRQVQKIGITQVLLTADSALSKDLLVAFVRKALSEKRTPVVVLFTTTASAFRERLTQAKINPDSVQILDTVSKTITRQSDGGSVRYIDSLRNLTQLQIKSTNVIEAFPNAVFIFDSLCVLDLYHTDDVIFKFFYSMTKLLHKMRVPGFYMVCKKRAVPKVIQFFDDFFEIR